MRQTLEAGVVCLERGDHRARPEDRVDAQVRPGAVGRLADDVDVHPHKAPVRDPNRELGGLGDDGGVGGDVLKDSLDPQAGVLLVGDGRHDDLPPGAGAARVAARDERCGEAALHVVRAAPDQPVAVDPGLQRTVHRSQADGVEVTAEHQGRSIARPPASHDDAWPASADAIVSAIRPLRSAHVATNRAISPSPAPPGTRLGLTESIETSCRARSMTSLDMSRG